MKELKDLNPKDLKEAAKALNDSGLLKKKIKLVATSNQAILDEFVASIDKLPEDTDFPAVVAKFYNSLFSDEAPVEDENGDADAGEEDNGDVQDDDADADIGDENEGDIVDTDSEITDENGDDSAPEPEPEPVKEKPKAKKDAKKADPKPAPEPEKPKAKEKTDKKPLVREKTKPEPEAKKAALLVEKRSKINPKLSMTKKVTNILNFSGQQYKQTAYFPVDVETVRILSENVGLYPSEVLQRMKQDKKVMKKLEKFADETLLREINKIKSAYSYIVGAITEEKLQSKFHLIMESLMAGKDVPEDVAHPTTVKVARRALLAYLDVAGIDYSVFKDTRKQLVKKASKKD